MPTSVQHLDVFVFTRSKNSAIHQPNWAPSPRQLRVGLFFWRRGTFGTYRKLKALSTRNWSTHWGHDRQNWEDHPCTLHIHTSGVWYGAVTGHVWILSALAQVANLWTWPPPNTRTGSKEYAAMAVVSCTRLSNPVQFGWNWLWNSGQGMFGDFGQHGIC